MKVTRWEGHGPPDEAAIRRLFLEERLDPERWSNGPGFVYAVHSHGYHKVIYAVEGGIRFQLPDTGAEVELGPGDRLELPAGTRHGAVVGDSGVICLEGHRS
ncbi:MAG: cupin domain-containing protein [Anaerolineae bacterium]